MDLAEALHATRSIVSGVTLAEATLLYELADAVHRAGNATVVEIGAYTGKSTILLGATGTVFSVDHHRGNAEHQPGQSRCRPGTVVDGRVDTYQLFRGNLQAAGLWENVIPVVTDHLTALSRLKDQAFPVGLLFVDAEHSYEATTSIIDTWVRRGVGTVLFHDYCDEFPEVIAAVDDAKLGPVAYRVDSIIGFSF